MNTTPATQDVSLSDIAQQMQTFAETTHWKPGMPLKPYRRTLSRGLQITFLLDAERRQFYLELTRNTIAPSELEERICRQAFAVPVSANRATKNRDDGTHSVRWRWTAYVQTELAHQVKETT